MSDTIDIKKFIKGNTRVFEQIYNSYAPNMYSHCLRMARNEDDAKDMLQESFIKVYSNRKKFNPEEKLGGWIRKIVINTSLNFIKKNYSIRFEDETKIDERVEVHHDHNTSTISSEQIKLLLKKLPEGYRIVFDLYVIEGLTHPEIAEYLNISVSTSKTQLFKARRFLKEQIIEITDKKRILNVS